MTIKCTSVAAHFDDHASVLEQYRQHYLMRHVHGYPGSHWTPPLGDYSLCIDLVATGLIANKAKMKKYTTLANHFVGHCDAPVWYDTTRIAR